MDGSGANTRPINEMNLFERHVREHLTRDPDYQTPEWIKRAKRNFAARARRFAKKSGYTYEEARAALIFMAEERAQGPDDVPPNRERG